VSSSPFFKFSKLSLLLNLLCETMKELIFENFTVRVGYSIYCMYSKPNLLFYAQQPARGVCIYNADTSISNHMQFSPLSCTVYMFVYTHICVYIILLLYAQMSAPIRCL